MPVIAQVYHVLIGCTADLGEEANAIVETISRWNTVQPTDNPVILHPVFWKSHGTARPGVKYIQEGLNRQIVDKSDIMVAVFWTRLGTKTPSAPSGTVEEIREFSRSGKPVSVYYSRRQVDPSAVDADQLRRLQSWEKEFNKHVLTKTFADTAELKDMAFHDLTAHVRHYQKSGSALSTDGGIEVRHARGDVKWTELIA